ncbi:phage shock protein operon transcriptional activator, partial [Escherichia coli]|nr:phage shock protein operon transcriptional activator [Escherichia coli]
VRELRNVVERAVYRWEQDGPIDAIEIDPFQSPWRMRPMQGSASSAPAPAAGAVLAQALLDEQPAIVAGATDFKGRVARFERELL